ncbi:A/G-specific adenine glycosylase [Ammonifex thiophilus]|uniref:Adenine DNA glycosylase n=1 Tax=Ammonifex thiophilus TaxID=444093 RepID=A0A3D8P321_9THEO|nr:A/G-specific adenine glycosylase [Ammonifex thiophilus]
MASSRSSRRDIETATNSPGQAGARDSASRNQLSGIPEGFFIQWFKSHGRYFPWRERHVTPFGVLVAEILLRQTKAEMVASCWPELVKRYPSPQELAQAREGEIWELVHNLGLGRQRVLALRAVSSELVRRFKGQVPASLEELLSLPHVGLYTAHAVCVFAFGMRLPVVDSNVIRLFSRLTGQQMKKDIRRCLVAWEIAWSILPATGAREHNFGLLDFAGTVCTSLYPACISCPISCYCVYHACSNKFITNSSSSRGDDT